MCYNKYIKGQKGNDKMRKVEYWIASDGKEFDTEKECYDHEHQYDDLASKITLLDINFNPIRTDNFIADVEDAYCIIVEDDEAAFDLNEFMRINHIENPYECCDIVAGHYYYDDYGWHSVEQDIEFAEDQLRKMERGKRMV